jgi:rod shape-determining protein MreD
MSEFSKNTLLKSFIIYFPTILLLVSVLNEFDFNYLDLDYFSFNFPFILIFYWNLKREESIGYGLIFIAGLINDVITGFPIGISSLSYLLICGFAAYLRNITLRPSILKDLLFFLFTVSIVNSFIYSLLVIFFSVDMNYIYIFLNVIFTFSFYYIFARLFDLYRMIFFGNSYE